MKPTVFGLERKEGELITIFGKPNCAYCTKAKVLLDTNGIGYEYRDIMEEEYNYGLMMELVPNARTVPQIIVNNQPIGGFDKLQEMINTPEGKKLLTC